MNAKDVHSSFERWKSASVLIALNLVYNKMVYKKASLLTNGQSYCTLYQRLISFSSIILKWSVPQSFIFFLGKNHVHLVLYLYHDHEQPLRTDRLCKINALRITKSHTEHKTLGQPLLHLPSKYQIFWPKHYYQLLRNELTLGFQQRRFSSSYTTTSLLR